MTDHRAACCCGQLRLVASGEPSIVSVCHCLACQRRTGSAFGAQAGFPRAQVKPFEGRAASYERVGDSGRAVAFRFCPDCGSTVFWTIDAMPETLFIALGAFADPTFPRPKYSIYESRAHAWALAPKEGDTIVHLP